MKRSSIKRRMIWVIAALFILLALYSFAGTSDQLESLTPDQRAEVVARWSER